MCFASVFNPQNYRDVRKRWNLFPHPNSKPFYLGQTLIFAPWLGTCVPNFTLGCGAVALQAGQLQPTTSGSIIKILPKVTMETAC